jgi:hypothetical protein
VFTNPTVLILLGVSAVISAVALSVWLAVNDRTAGEQPAANTRTLLTALALLGAWLATCACGGIAFVARTVNWATVLVAGGAAVLVALGVLIAVRIRLGR